MSIEDLLKKNTLFKYSNCANIIINNNNKVQVKNYYTLCCITEYTYLYIPIYIE